VTGQFQGAAAAFEGALSNLAVLLVIAVLVVYIVLGILYESYIHPLTILSGLPSAAFGALLTLMIFRMDLNIYAFVGTMAALLGAVPIAAGYGAGGEARQPLGLVVVGGLLFSQLVTLYLTPVFFTYMDQLQARLKQGIFTRVPETTS